MATKKKTTTAWNTVTPLSKTIAMGMLIILPFLGFYLGMKYQKMITPYNPTTMSQTSETPTVPANWKTYTNRIGTATLQYPPTWTVTEKHTLSNREVDNPDEINTALLQGKEGYIKIEWGPMGFGGGCDTLWKPFQIKNRVVKICNGIDATKRSEGWFGFGNNVDNDNATEVNATATTTSTHDVQTLIQILSNLELTDGMPQPTP